MLFVLSDGHDVPIKLPSKYFCLRDFCWLCYSETFLSFFPSFYSIPTVSAETHNCHSAKNKRLVSCSSLSRAAVPKSQGLSQKKE